MPRFKYIDIPNKLAARKKFVYDADKVSEEIERLLLTNKGDMMDRLDYGAGLDDYVYEPFDENTAQFIRMSVISALSTYMPEVKIRQVDVTAGDVYAFTITLSLYIQEFDKQVQINVPFGTN